MTTSLETQERPSRRLLARGERPRELTWYQAAGMLFGDWGTSRLYVLGMALWLSRSAGAPSNAFWLIVAISGLMVVVGWAYTKICAAYPDGGGVFHAARRHSPLLGIVGALLLIADYIVTGALSGYVAFVYLENFLPFGADLPWAWAAGAIALLLALNVYGPRHSGNLAVLVALLAIGITAILAVFTVQDLPAAARAISVHSERDFSFWWVSFTQVVLALSGVESISNMTGVMARPVGRTSRRAIFTVLAEVVIFNLILILAAQLLPDDLLTNKEQVQGKLLGILTYHYIGPAFAAVANFFFAFLLMSAANTAIQGMIGVMYALARGGELPRVFGRLNRYGVPWVALMATGLFMLAILFAVRDLESLADLYAIGVVGAVTITMASSAILPIAAGEGTGVITLEERNAFGPLTRVALATIAVVLACVELTIAYTKGHALFFAVLILVLGLTLRAVAKRSRLKKSFPTPVATAHMAGTGTRPQILVACRGGPKVLSYGVEEARRRDADLLVLFVREVAVSFKASREETSASPEEDADAQRIFDEARTLSEKANVTMRPLYVSGMSAAEAVLDQAAMFAVDCVILGVSQRGALWRTLRGDVINEVAQYLPEEIALIIRA